MVEQNKIKYEVSVKDLVQFTASSGDLVYRFKKSPTGLEGIRVHQFLQKKRPTNYLPEFSVKEELDFGDYQLLIRGRIDGVFKDQDPIVIEEIKSTYSKFEDVPEAVQALNLAQAKVYACIYLRTQGGLGAGIQMTYFDLTDNIQQAKHYSYSLQELNDFYLTVVEIYVQWQNKIHSWSIERNVSLQAMSFPFTDYRKGQRQMAVDVYRAIRDKKRLYMQAPTGIGKTLGVLFPALKNLGEGRIDRIFFLTAKTVGRKIIEETVGRLQKSSKLKTVTLTAKDKICFQQEGKPCNQETCIYAKGYYDKLRGALAEIWTYNLFDKETIELVAKKHEVCPFEFSLDISNWCDLIICDYNYAFDPFVYLKRFFDEDAGKNVTLLVDEAHNLVDRSRSMYSASVNKYLAFKISQTVQESMPDVAQSLIKIDKAFKALFKKLSAEKWEMEACVLEEIPKGFMSSFSNFQELIEEKMKDGQGENWPPELHQYYFEINRFLKIKEFFSRNYRFIFDKENNQWEIKLFCLDPSSLLLERLKSVSSVVFFSATLKPFDYFSKLIEGTASVSNVEYASPFDPTLQKLMIDGDVSTFFKERGQFYDVVIEKIIIFVNQKPGNYLLYMPSYSYLQEIAERLSARNAISNLVVQSKNMKENEKDSFLQEFHKGVPVVGLAVMGGIFSEGIDLTGEKLIGVMIVGVGLPSPSAENEILKNYFQDRFGDGFSYAYLLPGFNKVLQTAGRLIRTETDTGTIMLLDKRYKDFRYRNLFPMHWVNSIVK
jgi:DNA excision repair protein ERCC-2